jgi:uncharacterized membrane protein
MAHDPDPDRVHERDGDYGYNIDGRRWRLDRKENVAWVARALYAVCAFVLLLDFVVHRHAETGADGMWGFYAVYGFVGSVFLVMAAKQLRRILRRPEDYYDR